MSAEASPERFKQYEAALKRIAEQIQDQIALEAHQQRSGLSWGSVSMGRSDTYKGLPALQAKRLGGP